jgi:guanyl-specific ribonuclease Sa
MTHFYTLGQRAAVYRRPIGLMFAVCISVLSLPACGQDQLPAQQRTVLIGKIQAARAIDAENLANGKTDPIQAIDSVYQAQKAQRVIEQLKRGEPVAQPEIDDALDVPPESISPDARSELIRELTTAENRDEQGE